MPAGPTAKGGGLLIPVGYLFALLGGLIGVAIGGSLWQGKVSTPAGKVHKYNSGSRRHGFIMLALGSVMFAVSTQLADQIKLPFGGSQPTPTAVPAQPASGGGGQPAATTSQPASQPAATTSQPASRPAAGAAAGSGSGLTPNVAGSSDLERLVVSYLDAVHGNELQADGYTRLLHTQLGTLGNEASQEVRLTLPANSDIAYIGSCDNDCEDLDLVLFTAGGTLVDEDTLTDAVPIVRVQTAGSATEYVVRIGMVTCTQAPCYWGFRVYSR